MYDHNLQVCVCVSVSVSLCLRLSVRLPQARYHPEQQTAHAVVSEERREEPHAHYLLTTAAFSVSE